MRSKPVKRRRGKSKAIPAHVKISSWARTDVGLKREINEDSFLADTNLDLFIVADGMGGHAGGDIASRMAVEIVRERVREARHKGSMFNRTAAETESAMILKMLNDAISEASAKIFESSEQHPELVGMGTTVTAVLVHGHRAYIAHVGDSRLYRRRNGKLEQMTEDHSLVNEQVKAGFITAEEAQHSRFRNIITRSVGFESQVTADTFSVTLRADDLFLLCSDGLCGMVEDDEIGRTLDNGRLSEAVGRLVGAANQQGGEDNITVIILQMDKKGETTVRRRKSKKRKRSTKKTSHSRARRRA
jgi:protein phosphatase